MPTKPVLSDEDVAIAVSLYRYGYSLTAVGQELHVSKTTVKNYLLREGVKLRPKGGHGRNKHDEGADDIELIEHLYWTVGLSQSEIGRLMGLHQTAVLKRMHRHGVPRRSRQDANRARFYTPAERERRRAKALEQWRTGRIGRKDQWEKRLQLVDCTT